MTDTSFSFLCINFYLTHLLTFNLLPFLMKRKKMNEPRNE